jgi:hypothetical protein
MTGTTDNGWEDSSWSVVSGESSLAHAGTVVANQSGNILVTHDCAVDPVVDRTEKIGNVETDKSTTAEYSNE